MFPSPSSQISTGTPGSTKKKKAHFERGKEEKKKKKDYPKPWVISLPKTPLISAGNGKEDEDLCVLCVEEERDGKNREERECVAAEIS